MKNKVRIGIEEDIRCIKNSLKNLKDKMDTLEKAVYCNHEKVEFRCDPIFTCSSRTEDRIFVKKCRICGKILKRYNKEEDYLRDKIEVLKNEYKDVISSNEKKLADMETFPENRS